MNDFKYLLDLPLNRWKDFLSDVFVTTLQYIHNNVRIQVYADRIFVDQIIFKGTFDKAEWDDEFAVYFEYVLDVSKCHENYVNVTFDVGDIDTCDLYSMYIYFIIFKDKLLEAVSNNKVIIDD